MPSNLGREIGVAIHHVIESPKKGLVCRKSHNNAYESITFYDPQPLVQILHAKDFAEARARDAGRKSFCLAQWPYSAREPDPGADRQAGLGRD